MKLKTFLACFYKTSFSEELKAAILYFYNCYLEVRDMKCLYLLNVLTEAWRQDSLVVQLEKFKIFITTIVFLDYSQK